MALRKSLDVHNTGQPLAYWCITHARLDHGVGQVEVLLHGWRDEAARRQALNPGAPMSFGLSRVDLGVADLHGVTTASLYAALKRRAAARPDALERTPASLQDSIAMRSSAVLADAEDC
ncbi:MAG: hypothetical protein JO209_07755 [Acidisphaera sp.]|nr:hypothetical protein [Acidisphaera sp.]